MDDLEHAMQGVQTVECRRFDSRGGDPGILGRRSWLRVDVRDDTPVEHELTIVMRRLPHRKLPR